MLRTAVIGVGFFGRLHAQKHAALPGAELVGVVDIDRTRAEAVGAELGVPAHTDYRALLGAVDAVSVVVPTAAHFEVARAFVEAGAHVLVEKPITAEPATASALIAAAARADRVLQVGHLERFSAAWLGLHEVLTNPMFIDCQRVCPFKPRGTDVNVVLDMMIHDIDLVLDAVKAPVTEVDAIGVPVLSDGEDIANARLHFEGGCVASVTASRVSLKNERKIRLFQRDMYVRLDLHARAMQVVRRLPGAGPGGMPRLEIEERTAEEGDPLRSEIESFLAAARDGRTPFVTGEDGLRALECAIAITEHLRDWHRAVVG